MNFFRRAIIRPEESTITLVIVAFESARYRHPREICIAGKLICISRRSDPTRSVAVAAFHPRLIRQPWPDDLEKSTRTEREDIDLHGMMNRGTGRVGPIADGVGRGRR